MTPAEKRSLRARWSDDVIQRINTGMIRAVPKKPFLRSREELAATIASHLVDGVEYVDLRGFPFYELCHVNWSHVDFRGAQFKKGALNPAIAGRKGRMSGYGIFGSFDAVFTHCRFDYVDATGSSNFQGRYEDCSFEHAKIRRYNWLETRMVRSSFRHACLAGSRVRGIWRGCDLSYADLEDTDLYAVFEDCVFDNAVLDSAYIAAQFVRCSMENVSTRTVMVGRPKFEDTTPPHFDKVDITPKYMKLLKPSSDN